MPSKISPSPQPSPPKSIPLFGVILKFSFAIDFRGEGAIGNFSAHQKRYYPPSLQVMASVFFCQKTQLTERKKSIKSHLFFYQYMYFQLQSETAAKETEVKSQMRGLLVEIQIQRTIIKERFEEIKGVKTFEELEKKLEKLVQENRKIARTFLSSLERQNISYRSI